MKLKFPIIIQMSDEIIKMKLSGFNFYETLRLDKDENFFKLFLVKKLNLRVPINFKEMTKINFPFFEKGMFHELQKEKIVLNFKAVLNDIIN